MRLAAYPSGPALLRRADKFVAPHGSSYQGEDSPRAKNAHMNVATDTFATAPMWAGFIVFVLAMLALAAD